MALYLLDNSVVSHLVQNRPWALDRLQALLDNNDDVRIAGVAHYEQLRGLRDDDRAARAAPRYLTLVAEFGVEPVLPSHLDVAADVWVEWRAHGTPPKRKDGDILIAGQAIGIGASLATSNPGDFAAAVRVAAHRQVMFKVDVWTDPHAPVRR